MSREILSQEMRKEEKKEKTTIHPCILVDGHGSLSIVFFYLLFRYCFFFLSFSSSFSFSAIVITQTQKNPEEI
jgi:hypothetical protein